MYEGRTGIIDQFLPQEMWEGIISPLSFSYSPLQTDFCASKRGGRGRFFSVFSADTRSQTSVHCLIYGTVYERSFFAYLLHHATFARLKGEKKLWPIRESILRAAHCAGASGEGLLPPRTDRPSTDGGGESKIWVLLSSSSEEKEWFQILYT